MGSREGIAVCWKLDGKARCTDRPRRPGDRTKIRTLSCTSRETVCARLSLALWHCSIFALSHSHSTYSTQNCSTFERCNGEHRPVSLPETHPFYFQPPGLLFSLQRNSRFLHSRPICFSFLWYFDLTNSCLIHLARIIFFSGFPLSLDNPKIAL